MQPIPALSGGTEDNEKLKVKSFCVAKRRFFIQKILAKRGIKMNGLPASENDGLVFQYLRELFKFAGEKHFRFPGRSAYAALALMENNIQRGQWVARAIVMLAEAGFKYLPLPSPEVCEIMGLHELKKSLLGEK